MSHISAHDYREYHEDPALDNAIAELTLYCNACGSPFIPTELTSQKDEWCLCQSCADAITEMCEGRIT